MWRGRGAWEGGGRLGKRASATWSPCSSSILKMGQSRQHFSLLWAWNKILTHHQGVPPGHPHITLHGFLEHPKLCLCAVPALPVDLAHSHLPLVSRSLSEGKLGWLFTCSAFPLPSGPLEATPFTVPSPGGSPSSPGLCPRPCQSMNSKSSRPHDRLVEGYVTQGRPIQCNSGLNGLRNFPVDGTLVPS